MASNRQIVLIAVVSLLVGAAIGAGICGTIVSHVANQDVEQMHGEVMTILDSARNDINNVFHRNGDRIVVANNEGGASTPTVSINADITLVDSPTTNDTVGHVVEHATEDVVSEAVASEDVATEAVASEDVATEDVASI